MWESKLIQLYVQVYFDKSDVTDNDLCQHCNRCRCVDRKQVTQKLEDDLLTHTTTSSLEPALL